MTLEDASAQLGESTCDVFLNDRAFWKNVPHNVWEYTLGGYQVIKKWLSYRESRLLGRILMPQELEEGRVLGRSLTKEEREQGRLLGRPITPEEARHVTEMARRIAALLLLQPKLNANYQAVKAGAYEWRSEKSSLRKIASIG
jgi:hypothetical protein